MPRKLARLNTHHLKSYIINEKRTTIFRGSPFLFGKYKIREINNE